MDQPTIPSASNAPDEPMKTEQQLANILAGMMEELGAGRLDTLPLEDRGYGGHIPRTRAPPRALSSNKGIAGWQNLRLDDTPESYQHLDSIADGQLYRLRRDGAFTSPNRDDSSSTRGGRASTNHSRGSRGGGSGGSAPQGLPAKGNAGDRGGHSSELTRSGRGRQGGRGQSATFSGRATSSSSSKHNDFRIISQDQGRINTAIGFLTAPNPPGPALRRTKQPPATFAPPPFSHSASLLDTGAFFAAMGLNALGKPSGIASTQTNSITENKDATIVSQASRPVVSETREDLETAQPSRASSSTNIDTGSVPAAQAPAARFADRSTGITSSRWSGQQPSVAATRRPSFSTSSATSLMVPTPAHVSSQVVPATDSAPAASATDSMSIANGSDAAFVAGPPSLAPSVDKSAAGESVIMSDGSATANPLVLFDKPAKSGRDDAPLMEGKLRLVQVRDAVILEFIETNIHQSRKTYGLSVLWRVALATIVTFSFGMIFLKIETKDGSFQIKFRFPHEASDLKELLSSHLKELPTRTENVTTTGDMSIGAPSANFTAHESMTCSSASVDKTLRTPQLPAAILDMSEDVNEPAAQAITAPDSSNFESIHDVSGIVASPVTAMDENRQSSLTINSLQDVTTDFNMLIDFSEETAEETSSVQVHQSGFAELVCMNNYAIIASVLENLNKVPGGSFLNDNRDAPPEVLASLVENLTLSHLMLSRSFRDGFSEVARCAFSKEIAKQALQMALIEENQALCTGDSGSLFEIDDSASNVTDNKVHATQDAQSQQMPDSEQEPLLEQEVEPVDTFSTPRKYSIEELSRLRERAASIGALPQPPTLTDAQRKERVKPKLGKPVFHRQNSSDVMVPESLEAAPKKEASSHAQHSRVPSREQLVSKFASPEYQALFQTHTSSTVKSPLSKVTNSSTMDTQATNEITISTETRELKIAPALSDSIQIAVDENKPSFIAEAKGHRLTDSKDLTRLTNEFSALKMPTSAPLYDLKTLFTETNSNNGEEMKKARIPGLGASQWSSPASASRFKPQNLSSVPPQIQMSTVRGMEVIGTATMPVIAPQIVSPATVQDASGFQFPARPTSISTNLGTCPVSNFIPWSDMYDRQTSGSSTASEARPPLSPHKANIPFANRHN